MADNRNKMIYGRDVVGKRRPDKSAVALEYTLHDKAPKVIASGKGSYREDNRQGKRGRYTGS